ncbi:MAG: B12-binding domain-containing radical SAM protein [Desulfobacterota bacterium]|nr:B12-binding domain-containing radical SAM protein [Thermodesulfobacteriota bacterium]
MKAKGRRSEMYYAEPVYRPPSEAYSLLVQATVGCSSAAAGRCYFCNSTVFNRTIPEKKFRIRPTDEILEDIEIGGRQYGKGVDKIFLLDSNAMIIKTPELLRIVRRCYETFPNLKQVACYACCEDILRKTDEELLELRKAGLNLVFVGLESGDQEVLNLINKGVSVEDQIEAVVKANKAGIQTSVTVILGLGGKKLSQHHAVNTGKAATKMNPSFFAALTLMVVPGTVLDSMIIRGEFELVTDPVDVLKEVELMLRNIDAPGPVVFRTNHASNYLPLRGVLPRDKERLLQTIRAAMKDPRLLRSESMRGL